MLERKRVTILGLVQGVFFRDTVRRIASGHDVHGFVRNAGADALEIEAEGDADAVDAFVTDVLSHPPPYARIDDVRSESIPAQGAEGFFVAPTIR